MLKKVWSDPVWSKVISVGIIGVLTLCYTKFISITEQLSFREAFNIIIETKIPVIYVILSLLIYWIFKTLLRQKPKEKPYYSNKQKQLRSINKMSDSENGILFRWGVYFDYETPFLADLTPYCTKHEGAPIRFIDNRCPVNGCSNSYRSIDIYALKNFIESDLIDKWEKINQIS